MRSYYVVLAAGIFHWGVDDLRRLVLDCFFLAFLPFDNFRRIILVYRPPFLVVVTAPRTL